MSASSRQREFVQRCSSLIDQDNPPGIYPDYIFCAKRLSGRTTAIIRFLQSIKNTTPYTIYYFTSSNAALRRAYIRLGESTMYTEGTNVVVRNDNGGIITCSLKPPVLSDANDIIIAELPVTTMIGDPEKSRILLV